MALFKICRGKEINMPATMIDGYAYFCTDTRNFFIDWINEDDVVSRTQINSDCANKVRYLNGEEYVEIDAFTIHEHINDTNNPHKLYATQIGAVPATRTVNGIELSKDISLIPKDLGIVLDTSFKTEGAYAESKAVGDAIDAINKRINDVDDTARMGLLLARDKVYMTTETVTLNADSWSEKELTVELDSITTDNTVIVGSHPDNNTMYSAMGVYCSGQGEGTITFTCFETPEEKLKVNVIILE